MKFKSQGVQSFLVLFLIPVPNINYLRGHSEFYMFLYDIRLSTVDKGDIWWLLSYLGFFIGNLLRWTHDLSPCVQTYRLNNVWKPIRISYFIWYYHKYSFYFLPERVHKLSSGKTSETLPILDILDLVYPYSLVPIKMCMDCETCGLLNHCT